LAEESEYERVKEGESWRIESAREVVASRETRLVASSDAGREIELHARLLPREREILLAGGVLKHLQAGGQERIGVGEGESASAESGGPQSGGRS
jgi:hypothetical protein